MIRKFSCKNYKNINTDIDELEKINILIGPNNSGKSNFIKAISFFANMIINGSDNNFKSSFLQEVSKNNWGKMINRYAQTDPILNFTWEIELRNNDTVKYHLSFAGGEEQKDFYIVKEELADAFTKSNYSIPFNYFTCHSEKSNFGRISTAYKTGQKNQRINIEVNNSDTIIAQYKDKILEIPDLYNENDIRTITLPILDELQKYFKKFFSYNSTQFDLNKMKIPGDINELGNILKTDGSNFINVLNYYVSKDIYIMKIFEELIKDLMPNLETVNISSELGKLVFKMGYDGKMFDLSDMSDGTLKAILFAILICLPVSEGISLLAIDELELNLHPAWQQIIAKWIQLKGTFRQCFISTHSPDFLDDFTDSFLNGMIGLFVFEKDGKITKVKPDDIRSELEGWKLGDLYRNSDPLLGGWPW